MVVERLNSFQIDLRNKALEIAGRYKVEMSSEVGGGHEEYAAVIRFEGFVSWIYPDGADIGGAGVDKRFEIYDYASLDDLGAAYLRSLEQLLAQSNT